MYLRQTGCIYKMQVSIAATRGINVRSIMQFGLHPLQWACCHSAFRTAARVPGFRRGYFNFRSSLLEKSNSTEMQAVACAGAFLRLAVLTLPTRDTTLHTCGMNTISGGEIRFVFVTRRLAAMVKLYTVHVLHRYR